jgi:hypothetical protein
MNTNALYQHLLANPPLHPDGSRRRGGSHWDEFWRGYDGHRCLSARTSFGHAAWRAGRAYRQTESTSGVDFPSQL